MRVIGDEAVDVRSGDRDGELELRAVALTLLASALIVLGLLRRKEAAHRLGEPNPGAAHVTLPSSAA